MVLTGAVGAGAWGSAHSTRVELADLVARLDIENQVKALGYVTSEQLAALYASASLLAFPSRFEGFGLPVLEAMAAGCPVVAANATALPSLVGDAAVLVDPDDGPGWARAMSDLLADQAARQRLSDAGRARAAELAALDPVRLLVDVYARAGT